jgi:hypothetical protein
MREKEGGCLGSEVAFSRPMGCWREGEVSRM